MASPSKVIVIGAGLGGLACAISCRHGGLDVVVLERAPIIANIGAGIQVPPNSARVLQRFGLLSKFGRRGTTVEALELRRYQDGGVLCIRPMGKEAIRQYGAPWMVIHRQDYHAILLEEAERLGAEVILDANVIHLDLPRNKVKLENGTVMEADVIIGADGLSSFTREVMLEHAAPPTETGDLAYRATFSLEQLKALKNPEIERLCGQNGVTLWMGPDKHVVFYPLRGGKEYNMVLLRPDNLPTGVRTAKGDIGEMRETFDGWDSMLTELISCISSVLKWKLLHHEELETWTREHTVLLGDACHPTLPYQAQGAAMAVEDGAVLGILLGMLRARLKSKTSCRRKIKSDIDPVVSILKLYERLRKRRTTLNVQGALRNRSFYHMHDGTDQLKRNKFLGQISDWSTIRSEYTWVDSKYNQELLGHDSMEAAEREFELWWKEFLTGYED